MMLLELAAVCTARAVVALALSPERENSRISSLGEALPAQSPRDTPALRLSPKGEGVSTEFTVVMGCCCCKPKRKREVLYELPAPTARQGGSAAGSSAFPDAVGPEEMRVIGRNVGNGCRAGCARPASAVPAAPPPRPDQPVAAFRF